MRIRYRDENAREGEVDLRKVRAGDLVQFRADFQKQGGPQVREGEVGEVVQVEPERVRVRVPGIERAGAQETLRPMVLAVAPQHLLLLVDARDPRIGTHRI